MNFLKIKAENDRYFAEHDFPEMVSEYIPDFTPIKRERRERFSVEENITHESTVECILRNSGKCTVVLNFANALIAGGGYIMGGNAQEESLCRASMLYYAIKGVNEFYGANRRHMTPDYTDGQIYSRNVPLIRNDSGEMLESPVTCDFITCPAVNRYEAAVLLMPREKTNKIMERRIGKIASPAMSKEPQVIILGAFGCGAFGNRREEVFPMFERAVNRFTDESAEVIFAVKG
ncbi:MAG: TIGR02452 family protein [Ruminococcus sp.]|nr:TIGR02452 family protein [Ruminococcus sp.]